VGGESAQFSRLAARMAGTVHPQDRYGLVEQHHLTLPAARFAPPMAQCTLGRWRGEAQSVCHKAALRASLVTKQRFGLLWRHMAVGTGGLEPLEPNRWPQSGQGHALVTGTL